MEKEIKAQKEKDLSEFIKKFIGPDRTERATDISSYLLDYMELKYTAPLWWEPGDYLDRYRMMTEFILDLGWIEHTSDWDPYHNITLKDGTQHETASGYTDIRINEDGTITFQSVDGDDEEIELTFNMDDIHTIRLER